MKITVNPDTKSSSFGVAPEGEYELRIEAITQKQKQGGEYPYLEWKFAFADPDVKATEEGASVGSVFEITTLKPDSQFGVRAITDALGVEWGDFDTDEVIGMSLKAKVGIDEYNGKAKNVVKRFIPRS